MAALVPVTPQRPPQASAAPLSPTPDKKSQESQSRNPIVLLLHKVHTAWEETDSPGNTGVPLLIKQAERVRDGAQLAILQLATLWLFFPSFYSLLWVSFCSYVIYQVSVVARNVIVQVEKGSRAAAKVTQEDLLDGFFSEVVLLAMTIGHAVVSAVTKKEQKAPEQAANSPEGAENKAQDNVSASGSVQIQAAPSVQPSASAVVASAPVAAK
jgi:hypothetical protein